MLTFFIGLLTVVLVLVCLFLILLVQLPKKEAGMGQAFGGAATDALFGAGSGNALTKMTKWAAGIFFAIAIVLTIMGRYSVSRGSRLEQMMSKAPNPTAAAPTPAPAANVTPAPSTPSASVATPASNNPIDIKIPGGNTPVTPSTAPGAPTNAPAS